jgi:superfamily I DNA/RNA helicase
MDLSRPVKTLVLARNSSFLNDAVGRLREQGVLYENKLGKLSISPAHLQAIRSWTEITARKGSISVAEAKEMYKLMPSVSHVAHGFKELTSFGREERVTFQSLREKGGLLIQDQGTPWFHALSRIGDTDVTYYRKVIRKASGAIPTSATVRLSTIHSVKGAEADRVVLLQDMAARTAKEREILPDDEARVWYVAVTRARQELVILRNQTDKFYNLEKYYHDCKRVKENPT